MAIRKQLKYVRRALVTMALGVGLLGASVWAAPVSVVGGTAQLPDNVTITKASTTSMGTSAINQLKTNGSAEVQQLLQKYTVGKNVDVYQLATTTQAGIQTAWLYTVQPEEQLVNTYGSMLNPTLVDMALPAVNQQWFNAQPAIDKAIDAYTTVNPALAPLHLSVKLQDQAPITKVVGAQNPSYVANTRAQFNVDGFVVPEYVSVAVALTQPRPTVYVMVTDDASRQTFEPVFAEFVKTLH